MCMLRLLRPLVWKAQGHFRRFSGIQLSQELYARVFEMYAPCSSRFRNGFKFTLYIYSVAVSCTNCVNYITSHNLKTPVFIVICVTA